MGCQKRGACKGLDALYGAKLPQRTYSTAGHNTGACQISIDYHNIDITILQVDMHLLEWDLKIVAMLLTSMSHYRTTSSKRKHRHHTYKIANL